MYLILNSVKDNDANGCAEKPLAYFFGEKVSFSQFLKSSFTERPFRHVHCDETPSRKFTTNDESKQSQLFEQSSSTTNAKAAGLPSW